MSNSCALFSAERGDPVIVDLVGEPEVEVEVEWAGELLGEEAADRAVLGVGTVEQYRRAHPHGECVVSVPLTGYPSRGLTGEEVFKCIEIRPDVLGGGGVDGGEAGLIGQELSHRDRSLAVLFEAGDVDTDERVVVEQLL